MEAQTILHSRRLFQQFIVDGYTTVESERLSFIRRNQSKLRVEKYCDLRETSNHGATQWSNRGKQVILPSTFFGSHRYMDRLYIDGMTICSYIGFPDLFITFTFNPSWSEIQRLLTPMNLEPADRPDILLRVFQIKFKQMLADLRKHHLLGKVLACK